MRRPRAGVLTTVFGVCALAVFSLMFLLATLLALVVPGLDRRRRLMHHLARLGLQVLGQRLKVTGLELLPLGSCVVVANHASYIDGIVLKAALPPRFSFVVKREAAAMPVAGFLLKRIGSEFVDRHTAGGRRRDAMRVLRRAEEGVALVFFPEGTFDVVPGLQRFHSGAFAAAARGGMPVVPTVINGARRALPPDSTIPRPGAIRVEVLEPIGPATGEHATEWLRDESRRRMLEKLDEPDLAHAQAAKTHVTSPK